LYLRNVVDRLYVSWYTPAVFESSIESASSTVPAAPHGRLTIIFIAGLGHSGSTLLARMLGQQPGCVPVGEIGQVWHNGFARNLLCGCGTPFKRCEFWSAAVRHAFGGFEHVSDDTIRATSDFWQHRRAAGVLLLPGLRTARRRVAFDAYTDATARLLRAVQHTSGNSIIVDASKTPAHLLALTNIRDADVHVVHLVRDSRAVAHAFAKPRRRPEVYWTEEFFPPVPPLKTALLWDGINVLTAWTGKSAASYYRVRYEDLVRAPDAVLREVGRSVGVAVSNTSDIARDGLHVDVHHTISGDPMRFASGSLAVTPRPDWRAHMPASVRRSVTAVTWPLLRMYGYPLR